MVRLQDFVNRWIAENVSAADKGREIELAQRCARAGAALGHDMSGVDFSFDRSLEQLIQDAISAR